MFSLFRKSTQATPPVLGRPDPAALPIDYFRDPTAAVPLHPAPSVRPTDLFDASTQRFVIVPPRELLNAHVDIVDPIYQASGMTRAEFAARLYPILQHAAAAYQLVPASMQSHHREPGGLLQHSLQVARHAAHLGQFARFDRDRFRSASPEDQKTWCVALVLAALTHDAGKPLTDFRVLHPSFFTPGRLLPRLDEGAPTEDEASIYVPYRESLHAWLTRHGYREYRIHWLQQRYALHPSYRISLLQHWITALRLQSLPEKVLRVLYAVEPPSGSREADFWALIAKSDQRSATDYFPAISRHRGEIVADTLRRLVREGTWRPTPTDFPLRITPSQRMLLRVPDDLAQLAVHLDRHPEAFALASRGSPSLDDLVTLLQFECLIEISSTADTLFDASSLLGTTGGRDHRVLVLNEDLSRELLALARAAPAPAIESPQTIEAMAVVGAPRPATVGTTAAAPPPQSSTPCVAAAPPGPRPDALDGTASNDAAPVSPVAPAPTSTTAQTRLTLPPLIYRFLQYVQSLNPRRIHEAARSGTVLHTAAGRPVQLEVEFRVGIHLGRALIKQFAKAQAVPLTTVFDALLACPQIVRDVTPPPPAPTERLTLTFEVSQAIFNQQLDGFAICEGSPSPVTRAATPVAVPRAAWDSASAAAPPIAQVAQRNARSDARPRYLQALLFQLFAHPDVEKVILFNDGSTAPLAVPDAVLSAVVSQAQRDALPELAGCGTADVIRLFREHGFPVHPTTDALIFTTDIGKDWRSYILARDT